MLRRSGKTSCCGCFRRSTRFVATPHSPHGSIRLRSIRRCPACGAAKFSHSREVVSEAEFTRQGAALGDDERPSWDAPDWSSLADDELYRGQLRRRLVEALGELPPIYRDPVVLRDVQGLSTEEASGILKVKPQTLKSRLHRGRLVLRQQLAEFSDGLSAASSRVSAAPR